jgi:parallel beta-helix repeat protein
MRPSIRINKTVPVIIAFLLVVSACLMIDIQASAASSSNVLVVPDNYASISAAINHAQPGDIIDVKPGVYVENLQIDKPLTVRGGDIQRTVILGSGGVDRGANPVVLLASNNVEISGFTIKSQSYSNTTLFATGIIVDSDNCTITNNVLTNNYLGVFCSVQSSITITNNTITENIKDGVRFFGGSNNNFSNNTVTGNGGTGINIQGYSNIVSDNIVSGNVRGIGFESSYSQIFGNTVELNQESGIFLASSYNKIFANNLSENKYGVFITSQLGAPRENEIYSNNFINNSVNAQDNMPTIQHWSEPNALGNYWSDKPENKSAYPISENNIDNSPQTYLINTEGAKPAQINNPEPSQANSLIASWPFDTVDSYGVTPDATGKNPAVLGPEVGNNSYTPQLVNGKFGQALSFNGAYYATVPPSPSIETANEVTIDAWINIQSIKNATYNNIFVEACRTTAAVPIRTLGLAVNGEMPSNESSPPLGALRACVYTTSGGFNEIDTIDSVQLNQWIHVVFTRSETNGMHIYVDGKEMAVQVAAGTINPSGLIQRQTETYIGHDAEITIDNITVSNTAAFQSQPLWTQWWLWAILTIVIAGTVTIYYWRFIARKK